MTPGWVWRRTWGGGKVTQPLHYFPTATSHGGRDALPAARDSQRWRIYTRTLVDENRWRAQRYGIDEGMVDFGRGEIVPFPRLMDELLELIREDAEHFGCVGEVEQARTIVERGTSSHMQARAYRERWRRGPRTRRRCGRWWMW